MCLADAVDVGVFDVVDDFVDVDIDVDDFVDIDVDDVVDCEEVITLTSCVIK